MIDLGSEIQAGNAEGTTVAARKYSKLFAAPEVLDENLKSDYKSDVWSLGCVLYFLATEVNPWEASTREKVLKKVKHYHADK